MYRILVIEDAQIVREPLAQLLVSEGFDVASAADGHEAIAVLEARPVDLILLDVLMPRMDGVKFLSLLRGHEHLKHIAVIAVTGISDTFKLGRLRELGVRSILHKVRFSFDGLVDEIRRQVGSP